jgi:hypothetical protein
MLRDGDGSDVLRDKDTHRSIARRDHLFGGDGFDVLRATDRAPRDRLNEVTATTSEWSIRAM